MLINGLIAKYSPKNEFNIPNEHLVKFSKEEKSKQHKAIRRVLNAAEDYVAIVSGKNVNEISHRWCFPEETSELGRLIHLFIPMRCYITENSLDAESKKNTHEIFDMYVLSQFIDFFQNNPDHISYKED
jgi:hypothetical protein